MDPRLDAGGPGFFLTSAVMETRTSGAREPGLTAAYAPPSGSHAGAGVPVPAAEVFERAAAHGDEHAVKFADTALDVARADGRAGGRADSPATTAALRALELIVPAW